MPRFYFHVHDGPDEPDTEGTDLPDLRAAKREAAILAGMLLKDKPEAFWQSGRWSVDVLDDEGRILLTLSFQAVDHRAPG